MTPSNRCIECSKIYFKLIGGTIEYKNRRKNYMRTYYKNNKIKWKN